MAKAPLDDIAKWSRKEQEAALARLRFLLGDKSTVQPDHGFEHDWLLAGVRDELKRRHMPGGAPLEVLKKSSEWKDFAQACEEIAPWAREALPGAERTALLAFSSLLARCLARHISSFRPVTMASMLHFYHRVPEAFDTAFPSYVANGWVPMILERRNA